MKCWENEASRNYGSCALFDDDFTREDVERYFQEMDDGPVHVKQVDGSPIIVADVVGCSQPGMDERVLWLPLAGDWLAALERCCRFFDEEKSVLSLRLAAREPRFTRGDWRESCPSLFDRVFTCVTFGGTDDAYGVVIDTPSPDWPYESGEVVATIHRSKRAGPRVRWSLRVDGVSVRRTVSVSVDALLRLRGPHVNEVAWDDISA